MRALERQFANVANLSVLTDVTSLIAVSGGPDSVALLRLLLSATAGWQVRPHLLVGHFNHGWRGDAVDDEDFVRALADQFDLPYEIGRAEPNSTHSEAVARQLRYDFLIQTAHQHGARYVLTGHTADDLAETVLFHALRGSGLRGLCGIPETRALDESLTVKRPLLKFTRQELLDYLEVIRQPFCADLSNHDLEFTRNHIRHVLLPQVAKRVPGDPRAALRRVAMTARAALVELTPKIDAAVHQSVISRDPAQVTLDCERLRETSPLIVCEALAQLWQQMNWSLGEMNYAKWNQLVEMISCAEESVAMMPGCIRATRVGNRLQLASQSSRDTTK